MVIMGKGLISRENVLFLVLLVFSCHTPREEAVDEYYRVTRIVDGDTFWIDDGSDRGMKIRLIGVDAPETRRTARKETGLFGEQSKEYLKRLLFEKRVRLDCDLDRTDRYGRTLAYVYLEDGTFVNAELLKLGYAMVLTIPPNVKFADEFVVLQREAREKRRGLWGE